LVDVFASFDTTLPASHIQCRHNVGRGKSSHAYFHSLHEDHHVFINLQSLSVRQDALWTCGTDLVLTDLFVGLHTSRWI
jgi:uncharacterized UBP type Zn finger protein